MAAAGRRFHHSSARLLWSMDPHGGVAQLVERLHGMQEVRGFDSHRLHPPTTTLTRENVDCVELEGYGDGATAGPTRRQASENHLSRL